ncbi:universal stress protein [Chitinimonas sp.]|uniref:universal stress protein n=1 Tax=Chitinimonas sp. TaxID=1934313 RepID=UPI002F92F979
MNYRSILVHVDSSERSKARIALAKQLAEAYEAHLTGVFVAPSANIALVGPYPAAAEVYYEIHAEIERDAEAARKVFEQQTLTLRERCEWQQHINQPTDALSLAARYHDLLILGQTEPGKPVNGLPGNLTETVVMGSGRPVLAVPYTGEIGALTRHALVAWNGSREATRALTDALPLLKRAERVTVLTINPKIGPDGHGELPGADIALYLARHGIKVEVARETAFSQDLGECLLNWIADHGVDLLVMGLYGHSRLRELALGGASRTVLQSMTVPVLMSH